MPTRHSQRPGGAPPPTPPYGLPTTTFPFPALARLAGLAPIGGSREAALAALVGARLVHATLPPYRLAPEHRDARANAALGWLSAITLEPTARTPLQALYQATGGEGDHAGMAAALRMAREAVGACLDDAAAAELDALLARLTPPSPPSSSLTGSPEPPGAPPADSRPPG